MINSEMLLNILSPETIEKLGKEQILEIKALGNQTKYLTTYKSTNPYMDNLRLEYETKRILELANSNITKNLDDTSKTLFCSEIKFNKDSAILKVLEQYNISLEDVKHANDLIKECQQNNIKYTMELIQLENKYELKYDQAVRVIKLTPSLLNNNYVFNKEDKLIYNNSKKFLILLSGLEMKKRNCFIALNEDPTIKKIVSIGKNYFGLNEDMIFILMNKINELVTTCPEKFMVENQKTLKKED